MKAETRPIVRYWIPLTGYLALIFSVSSLSHPEVFAPTLSRSVSDKVTHALEYGPLSILYSRAFRSGLGCWAARHGLLLSVLACAAYGLSDEIHQALAPIATPAAGICSLIRLGPGAPLPSCA